MEYRIIGGNTLAELQQQVNEYMKAGYEPCGSIFSYNDTHCVHQPMLRGHLTPAAPDTESGCSVCNGIIIAPTNFNFCPMCSRKLPHLSNTVVNGNRNID